MSYAIFKLLHLLGAVLFLGTLLLTLWWKLRADCSADARNAAFTVDQLIGADLRFTAPGAVLLLVGGGGLLAGVPDEMVTQGWLSGGIILFVATVVLWAVMLVPLQRQMRAALRRAGGTTLPDDYRRLSRYWLAAGVVAALLPLASLALMVLRPGA